jgi:hypothetical protein
MMEDPCKPNQDMKGACTTFEIESGNNGGGASGTVPTGMTSRQAAEELAIESWEGFVLVEKVTNSSTAAMPSALESGRRV